MYIQRNKIRDLPIKYRGYEVRELTKYNTNGKKFTRDEVKKWAEHYSKEIKKKGFRGKVMTSIYVENLGWRSGKIVDIGEKPPIFALADYEGCYVEEVKETKAFKMYFLREGEKPRTGRTNNKSDCFFRCLSDVIPSDNLPFKSGKELSDFLKVSEHAGVSIDDIPKVEKKLKIYRINVHGDHQYISTHPGKIDINLNLIDGHYTLRKPKNKGSHFVFNKRKIPLVYDINHENDAVKCCTFYDYDKREVTYFEIPFDYFKEIKSKPKEYEFKHKMPYVFIAFNNKRKLDDPDFSMERHLKEYTEQANIISFETSHELDLLRTNNFKNGALDYFHKLNTNIIPEYIEAEEVEYIYKASFGALIWDEKYEGELHKYDVCSHYPSIMKMKWMRFPFKKANSILSKNLKKE